MKKCKHGVEIKITETIHDINISDIFHEDNSITITKEEGKFLLKKLIEIYV